MDIGGEIWRLVSLNEIEYTLNSHCHKSHSRIDFLLISHPLIDLVVDCKMRAIALSDCGMVELHMDLNTDIVKRGHWRLILCCYKIRHLGAHYQRILILLN